MSEKEKVAADVELTSSDRTDLDSVVRPWTTTRRELWAFYVYYIVSEQLRNDMGA